jgi:accessory colonization factor AcfC
MFESIRQGLLYNHSNYELYLMLGNYYRRFNADQAYLCYENALFYCDNEADLQIIAEYSRSLCGTEQINVRPCSIVIASYNNKNIMQDCIKSIKDNNSASSVEIIVVDNASTDGVTD